MADTVNTGIMLIEEGALMPGSLRFESEPWTPFYMAGEIIRESREASGKQSKYVCEGNMAHSDKVIDHYDHACDIGSLPKDDPNGGTGLLGAPECGDVMKRQMKINSEPQVIEEAEFKTFGCGSAIASSSLTTERVTGKSARKRWAIKNTNIVCNLGLPPCNPALWNRILQNRGERLHLVGTPDDRYQSSNLTRTSNCRCQLAAKQ